MFVYNSRFSGRQKSNTFLDQAVKERNPEKGASFNDYEIPKKEIVTGTK